MKTLHLYLTREVLLSLAMTAAVFTFVLLLGNVLKEIIALLIARQITPGLVLRAIGLLLPYTMVYVLPFGILTAVLLVFGRFSADQELTAVRASGVSLVCLSLPVLALSIALCAICALFNLWIGPRCRNEYKSLIFEVGGRNIQTLISEDRFITEIPGVVLYVRKKDGNEMHDVRLYTVEDNHTKTSMSAESGWIEYNERARTISFHLRNVLTQFRREPEKFDPNYIGPPPPEDPTEWRHGFAETYDHPPIDLTPLFKGERKAKLSEMDYGELRAELEKLQAQGIPATPVRVQMHRQMAFSFASFAFTLVAIPLAIRAHRRETSIGVAIALMLVLLYYAFVIAGEALQTKERFHPELIVWFPNFLFQGIGAYLLYRANRN